MKLGVINAISGSVVDDRFRREMRELRLPNEISLQGNAMHKAIAMRLLTNHAPRIKISDEGMLVHLMSMEEFGTAFVQAFLEENDPPQPITLLHTIPEYALVDYAREHAIKIIRSPRNAVREMLDNISRRQPQTYSSLCRSAQRLRAAAEDLRIGNGKARKDELTTIDNEAKI